MPTADEYRAMADECLQWAREAMTDKERALYLAFAKTWLEEASHRDNDIRIRLPPAPGLLRG